MPRSSHCRNTDRTSTKAALRLRGRELDMFKFREAVYTGGWLEKALYTKLQDGNLRSRKRLMGGRWLAEGSWVEAKNRDQDRETWEEPSLWYKSYYRWKQEERTDSNEHSKENQHRHGVK